MKEQEREFTGTSIEVMAGAEQLPGLERDSC